jgi:transposase
MSAVVCGLDVHKETTYATILDPRGQVLVQRKMMNEDIPAFLDMMKPEKLAMEASTYIIPLYRKLTEQGFDVTVSHPRKTRLIAARAQRKEKTRQPSNTKKVASTRNPILRFSLKETPMMLNSAA